MLPESGQAITEGDAMRTIRFSLTKLALVLASLSILAVAPDGSVTASAADRCTNSSLRGSFAFHSTGTTPTGDPFATVGIFRFDGNGNLTATLFQRRTGGITVGPISITGTYTVNPDCTVSDAWIIAGSVAPATHELVIFDNGRGFFLVNTTAVGDLAVISGEGRKQFVGHRGKRENDEDDDEDSH
jgi:hypothetical protein